MNILKLIISKLDKKEDCRRHHINRLRSSHRKYDLPRGVTYSKKNESFYVKIKSNCKPVYVGYYGTIHEAMKSYAIAKFALRHFTKEDYDCYMQLNKRFKRK